MDLINKYVQEVTRRLPSSMREDVALELESTIYDMLPDNYSESDVNEQLETLGNPAILASRYSDKPSHLIGPGLYHSYISTLKIVLLISLLTLFIIVSIEKFTLFLSDDTSLVISFSLYLGEVIWTLLSTLIQVFFWVTLVFIIIERTNGSAKNIDIFSAKQNWSAADLKKISYIPLKKKISISELIFNLFWILVFSFLYLSAANIIKIDLVKSSIPVFNADILQSYILVVFSYVFLQLLIFFYMAIVKKWTKKLALTYTCLNLISLILIVIVASDPELISSDFIVFMATTLDSPLDKVKSTIFSIKWFIVLSFFVTNCIEAYKGFKKASY